MARSERGASPQRAATNDDRIALTGCCARQGSHTTGRAVFRIRRLENIAEIELSVLARGCLARRIPDRATLAQELRAWQRDRNQSTKGIPWQFTTADARVKLIKLYPSPHA